MVILSISLVLSLLPTYYYTGIKCVLSYLFLPAPANADRWKSYTFNINKFFRIIILLFCALYISSLFLSYRSLPGVQLLHRNVDFYLCRQNSISTFNRNPTLPKEWYYKFLYICTLQILPHLVVWKFYFFSHYKNKLMKVKSVLVSQPVS